MNLTDQINKLTLRAERLQKGEKLCDHHWNGSDRCYECYCTGCQKHLMEICNEENIPFEKDAYCYQCQKTPEEKALEKFAQEVRKQKSELATLALLIQAYPEEAKQLLGQ